MSREQEIRDQITKLIERSGLGVFNQSVYDKIEQIEFELQDLGGDDRNELRHRSKNLYKFRCSWVGRKFKCVKTGEVLTIPDTITYGSFFEFGESFIDVGDGYYSRFGGEIEEIKVDYSSL